jgi:GTP-binding protein
MLSIKKVEFIKSVANNQNIILDDLPQVAFVGRSNVGKSSLINYLVNQKIARTSNTPGRTRLINYFKINDNMYFVDLPGYGYASGEKQEVYSWKELIDGYLLNTKQIRAICFLLDSRRSLSEQDKQMVDYLYYYGYPIIFIATKVDKLKKTEFKIAIKKLANDLKIVEGNLLPCSVQNGSYKSTILNKINQLIALLPNESLIKDNDENE